MAPNFNQNEYNNHSRPKPDPEAYWKRLQMELRGPLRRIARISAIDALNDFFNDSKIQDHIIRCFAPSQTQILEQIQSTTADFQKEITRLTDVCDKRLLDLESRVADIKDANSDKVLMTETKPESEVVVSQELITTTNIEPSRPHITMERRHAIPKSLVGPSSPIPLRVTKSCSKAGGRIGSSVKAVAGWQRGAVKTRGGRVVRPTAKVLYAQD